LGIAGIIFGLLAEFWLLVYLGLGVCVLIAVITFALEKLFVPPFYRAANKQLREGDVDSALELINKSIEARPQSYESYATRAYLYICKNQFAQAKQDAQYIIQLKPDYSLGYRVLGQWFYFQSHYAEAIDPFSEALRLDPKDGVHYCTLGLTYYRLKEYKKAVEHLQRAISMKSSIDCSFSTYYYLGRSFEQLGQEEKTDELFAKMRKYVSNLKTWENQYKDLPDDYPAVKLAKEEIEEVKEILRV
jgi:tetratricopeptide (TPR) repeat protein